MVLMPVCVPDNCGKDFRHSLKKPSPNYPYGYKTRKPRLVPAFTIQAMQKNTRVIPPKKCGIFDPKPVKPSMFRKSYSRGEFPVQIEFTSSGKRLSWKSPSDISELWRWSQISEQRLYCQGDKVHAPIFVTTSTAPIYLMATVQDSKVPIEKLDFHHYLPMFFDGLAEGDYPFAFIVENGINDLVSKGSYKILPVVPQLIIPIKNALSTKRPNVICHTLKCIQMIVTGSDRVGEAFVPYYRQILPIFNLFKDKNSNMGSGIDHSSSRGENVGDLIEETLQILERYGGPDAFINIKYMIPTYESCVLN